MLKNYIFKKFAKLGYEHVTNDNDPKDIRTICFRKSDTKYNFSKRIDISRKQPIPDIFYCIVQSYDEDDSKTCEIKCKELFLVWLCMIRFYLIHYFEKVGITI